MHQFGNGDFLDLTAGQLTASGISPLSFVEAKYSHGNWFGQVIHMDVTGSSFGSVNLGYTHNLGGADLTASIGKLYSSGGIPDITKFSVTITVPLGGKADSSVKKSSQGAGGVDNRSFTDFNYIESIFGGAA